MRSPFSPPAPRLHVLLLAFAALALRLFAAEEAPSVLVPVRQNNPGLIVDLGTGLWPSPLPMDYNGDGLMDLVVVTHDKPSQGVYYFENTGQAEPQSRLPVFKPAVRLGDAISNVQVSYPAGRPVVTSPGLVYPDFKTTALARGVKIPAPERIHTDPGAANTPAAIRAKQWRYVDYDGDSRTDLVVGIDFWGDYGWDNAWDAPGHWQNGPLHGYVYLLRNTGTEESPVYAAPEKVMTEKGPVDVLGMPSPSFADFRHRGVLDLICGDFLDGFTYFENIGTRQAPRYAAGRVLMSGGQPLKTDLCMKTVVACDFNGDGQVDLIAGDEDGRVLFFENTGGLVDGMPQFRAPCFFRQYADQLKFGGMAIPVSFDWDGDGLDDLISGNTAGYVGFIKNLGGNPPRWAAPVYLSAEGRPIREIAGPNGSIQGPAEAKWGYSNPSVADWDGDGLPDLMVNGIWGRVIWYRNIGTRTNPRLAPGQPVEVAWKGAPQKPAWNWWTPHGRELATHWRSTPLMIDLNRDALMDLVTFDAEGYLALFERRRDAAGKLELLPPRRVFHMAAKDQPLAELRLSVKPGGGSGRRTFCFADWDGDGKLDLIVNGVNAEVWRNVSTRADEWTFASPRPVDSRRLAGHNTGPTVVDWDKDGVPDLVIGAEDGRFYYLANPRTR